MVKYLKRKYYSKTARMYRRVKRRKAGKSVWIWN